MIDGPRGTLAIWDLLIQVTDAVCSAAALAYFQKWPYFINWSPSALHGFVMYALVEDTDGVRLKTDVVQEAIAYDPHGPPQAWACLAAIERSVALHWIMPNTESPWGTSRMDLIKHRVGNTSSCFMNSGHFVSASLRLLLSHEADGIPY